MTLLLVFARLLLCVVFLIAGLTKLADLAGSQLERSERRWTQPNLMN
jgi:uncharacterized membrane protein YphA (DoxX/SURF4 family)